MPRPAFGDSDDEDRTPVVQALTEFSAKTLDAVPAEEPLTIARIPNSFRRTNKYIPGALIQPAQQSGKSVAELEAAEKARNNVYGLSKGQLRSTLRAESKAEAAVPETDQTNGDPRHARTDEELAVLELLNPEEQIQDHTIERVGGNELFSRIHVHPDMSTLDDYEAVPVESFGLAMLRGMGYDPKSEEKKNKVKEKLRRPDFLGLGASERPEESKTSQELAKKRFEKRKEDRNYVPVIKVNKRTGEIVTEASKEDTKITTLKQHARIRSPVINDNLREQSERSDGRKHHPSRSHRETSPARRSSDRHGRGHNQSREQRRRSRSPRRDSRDSVRHHRDRHGEKR